MPTLSTYTGPWNEQTARHLLRRAGFGIPLDRVEHFVKLGCRASVDELIEAAWKPDGFDEPDFLPDLIEGPELREMMQGLDDEERRRRRQQYQRENRIAISDLMLWWMKRMYSSPAVLREKMTLFWHGHFAVSAEKVKQAQLNYDLNDTLRRYAMGRFDGLVGAVAKSPAMLRYLDNDRNVKGQPNENFARELMELFTLGVGNYTERDIKEAARAFTGWSQAQGRFIVRQRQHDTGRKEFFGRSGNFDGEDIIAILMEQPRVEEFIGAKIWSFFAYEAPEDELVAELAGKFRDENLDVTELLRAIFTSEAFYSPRAMWTQIKAPVYYIVELHGLLDTHTPRRAMIQPMLRLLGQLPFYPPNVKGWDYGRAWINANTLLLRTNIAGYLVNGEMPDLRPNGGPPRRQQRNQRDATMVADDNDMIMQGGDDMMMLAGANPQEDELEADNMLEAERLAAERTPIQGVKTKPPLDLPDFLALLGADSPDSLVDRAIERFLGHRLAPDQRARLVDSVNDVQNIATPTKMKRDDQEKVRGMLHLILSSAEFQLC